MDDRRDQKVPAREPEKKPVTQSATGSATELAAWPEHLTRLFEQAITVEYTSLTRTGRPIMVPVTPYLGRDRTTVDVSTGLTYPAKAERARRNNKVCLLFADASGSGSGSGDSGPPVVLVHGLAAVRDADLQANTDRYVRSTLAKLPAAFTGTPRFVLRRLPAYFARIWVEVTPVRIWWWDAPDLAREPQTWAAPAHELPPRSDPAPRGREPAPWVAPPPDWRAVARAGVARRHHADVSWVGPDGWPFSVPVLTVAEVDDGLLLRVGAHVPDVPHGAGCVTLHTHTPTFTTQENHTFVGELAAVDGGFVLREPRVLGDVSLAGNRITRTLGFLGKVRTLQRRLEHEAGRRGQPPPVVNLP